jgi:acyl-CoA synthetase (AMP-forming)/AMP-acid ligase II
MQDIFSQIQKARSNNSIPIESLIPEYSSFRELLFSNSLAFPSKEYCIFYSETGERISKTYSEIHNEARALADYLQSLGVGEKDKVVIAGCNHIETVIQYFAIWYVGACVVPLNMSEDVARLEFIINNSNAKVILCRNEYQSIITNIALKNDVHIEVGYKEYKGNEKVGEIVPTTLNHLFNDALLIYTSGTTGNPKGVLLQQINLFADCGSIANWHQITSDTRMMCVLPIHHVNGIVVTIFSPMLVGASLVLNHKFSPSTFFQRISDEGVHIVSVVPTLLAFLLEAKADSMGVLQKGFRNIICGAGPLTCDLAMRFEQHYSIPIIHGYGLSETTCYSCYLPIELTTPQRQYWLKDFQFPSIGVPLPCNEMSILNSDGTECDELERGEIVIRGWNVMKEYFQNDAANISTFSKGWFQSGDEGFYKLGEDGNKYFFITGRLKELFIRGGVNISPLEIDEVINKAPGVKAGISVGFENDMYGEEIGALVITNEQFTNEKDLLDYFAKHLPFHKCPKVVLITDALPVTSTGKYQRNKVKHLFQQFQSAQFRK